MISATYINSCLETPNFVCNSLPIKSVQFSVIQKCKTIKFSLYLQFVEKSKIRVEVNLSLCRENVTSQLRLLSK